MVDTKADWMLLELRKNSSVCRNRMVGFPKPFFSFLNLQMPTIFDPSELRTDVTGKVVRYLQDNGAEVQAGAPFVEVEAMKMIMPIKATETGKITHNLSPGSVISAGDLLASLELKDLWIEPFVCIYLKLKSRRQLPE